MRWKQTSNHHGKLGGDPERLPHVPRRQHKWLKESANTLVLPQMWHANEWILFRANNNQISRRQHCMKLAEDRRLLSAYTLTWLSVSISTVQPRNRSCHTFKDTRMVSNSNWLMFSLWWAIKGGKGASKNLPKQAAPQASRQASHANKLGLETVTFVGMTETPL